MPIGQKWLGPSVPLRTSRMARVLWALLFLAVRAAAEEDMENDECWENQA